MHAWKRLVIQNLAVNLNSWSWAKHESFDQTYAVAQNFLNSIVQTTLIVLLKKKKNNNNYINCRRFDIINQVTIWGTVSESKHSKLSFAAILLIYSDRIENNHLKDKV